MKIEEVKSIEDVKVLVAQGFTDWKTVGDVSVKDVGFGWLFNYTARATFENRWNAFEQMSRGLIVSKDGSKVIARPFDKFWNWGERGRQTGAPLLYAMEKMDGSMGAVFWNPVNSRWQVSTRGSVDSEQAQWATRQLKNYDLSMLDRGLVSPKTLIVEIVYPENRIVVDYQGKSGLFLLAVRDNDSGKYVDHDVLMNVAREAGFPVPTMYRPKDADALVSSLDSLSVNEEGFVAVFADGHRFKFKGGEYLKAHKVLSGINYSRTVQYVIDDDIEALLEIVPDEWLDEVKGWLAEIHEEIKSMEDLVESLVDEGEDMEAKEFVFMLKALDVEGLVFACAMKAFRGHEYRQEILKSLKKKAASKTVLFSRFSQ